jgi:hypothetical protein
MDNEVGGGDVVFMLQLLQSGGRNGIVLCWCGNTMLMVGWDVVKVGFNFGFVVVLGTFFFLILGFWQSYGTTFVFSKFGHIYKGYLVEDESIFGKM